MPNGGNGQDSPPQGTWAWTPGHAVPGASAGVQRELRKREAIINEHLADLPFGELRTLLRPGSGREMDLAVPIRAWWEILIARIGPDYETFEEDYQQAYRVLGALVIHAYARGVLDGREDGT